MKQRLVIVILLTAFSLALCLFSLFYVRSSMAAQKHGVQIVYQEVDTALVPTLSVAENVMLNNLVLDTRNPVMRWNKVRREARAILERLHINVNVRKLVQNLTLAQKQMVLIAKAIASQCNFLILDEPTAPLSDTETAELFRLVRHSYLRFVIGFGKILFVP